MGKTLRFRMYRLIKTSFQSCSSKQPPTSSPHPQPPPPSSSSFKQHITSAFISLGCGCARNPNHRIKPQEFMWQKQEEEWHIIPKLNHHHDTDHSSSPRRKIYNSSVSNDNTTDYDCISPPTPPPKKANKKRRTRKKKTTTNKKKKRQYRISTSSPDSGLTNIFSSEERELVKETETLVSSSRSSSADLETKMKWKCRKSGRESPARLSVLKRQWRVEGGKVRAVVKKSEDPYGDFKASMMEMICDKHIYEETDLEQLLLCFLSLNSPQHHPTILLAFSHIWNALFSPTTSSLTHCMPLL